MKIFKQITIHLLFMSFFIVPVFVLAQGVNTPATDGNTSVGVHISNPLLPCGSGQDCNSLMGLIAIILNNIVMPIAAVAVVIWIVYAGFTFITAQGKPAEIQKAQQRLLWSLIGAGILLGAAGISKVVQVTVNALIATP